MGQLAGSRNAIEADHQIDGGGPSSSGRKLQHHLPRARKSVGLNRDDLIIVGVPR